MADVVALPQPRSEEENKILTQQALQGSPEAADHVAGWYLLLMGNGKLDWATVAAENGSPIGADNIASILSDGGLLLDSNPYGDYSRDRIWFWLHRAADHGDEYAIEHVKLEFPEPDKMRLEPEQEIQRWRLSEKTLPQFKRAAMRGSPDAAYRLYQYHADPKEHLFWARIGAQNGHPQAPIALSRLLLKSRESNDHIRAEFWLKKAIAGGNKEAAKLLQRALQVDHEENTIKP